MDQIDIRMHEDLSNVSEKFYLFTLRQWIGIILTTVLTVPLYRYLTPILGDDISSWIIIFVGIPPIAYGFLVIQGLHFEKLLPYIKRQYIAFIKPLEYKTDKEILSEKEAKQQRWKKFQLKKTNVSSDEMKKKSTKKNRSVSKQHQPISEQKPKEEHTAKVSRKQLKKEKKLEKQRVKELKMERKQAKELAKAKKKYGDWEKNSVLIQQRDDLSYNNDKLTEEDWQNIILLSKKAEQLQDIVTKKEEEEKCQKRNQ